MVKLFFDIFIFFIYNTFIFNIFNIFNFNILVTAICSLDALKKSSKKKETRIEK